MGRAIDTATQIGIALFVASGLLIAYTLGYHGVLVKTVTYSKAAAKVEAKNWCFRADPDVTIELFPAECKVITASLSDETMGEMRNISRRRVQCQTIVVSQFLVAHIPISRLLQFETAHLMAARRADAIFAVAAQDSSGLIAEGRPVSTSSFLLVIGDSALFVLALFYWISTHHLRP